MKQGEIRHRLDTSSALPDHVLILSGRNHIDARRGRVVVCRVLPGTSSQEFVGTHRVSYTVDGVTTIGVAVPELIAWLPRSGLSEPVGLVQNMHPVLAVVHALFE